jgi:putative transposase
MTSNLAKYHRRSIRLDNYDYTENGAYFVTICTHERQCLFGNISGGAMCLNEIGEIVQDVWLQTVEIRHEIMLDAFVVMPNHVHGVVLIRDDVKSPARATRQSPLHIRGPQNRSLGSFIAGFKSMCTISIKKFLGARTIRMWQRNYYEHIIRSEKALDAIREYIHANPARWQDDPENPERNIPRGS